MVVAGLYLLGMANGAANSVTSSIISKGFWGALFDTFDVSVVVIAATAVGLRLAMHTPDRPIDRLDRLTGAVYLLGLCVPLSPASLAALTFLAVYESSRNFRSVETLASSSLFLGIAVCQMWGALVLDLFAPSLLALDAAMAARVLNLIQGGGVESIGNLVETAQGQPLAIMTGCSSLSHMSYAFLCWLTMVRACRPSWQWTDLPMALVVATFVIGVNIVRLALMGISRDSYLLLHGPVGAYATSVLILFAASAAAWRTLAFGPAPARPADM
jgi:hypothetical protein